MTPKAEHQAAYDAVIAGAGPAGAATAIGLARAGRQVLLVDKRAAPRLSFAETLAPGAKPQLEGLLSSLGQDMLPCWAAPNRGTLSVWGAAFPAEQGHDFNPYGTGLCVDRVGLDAALVARAEAQGVTVLRGVAVTEATYDGEFWALRLSDGDAVARYLIDATGRAAAVSRLFGITHLRPDPLFAYALRFQTDADDDIDALTRIEAGESGWWYSNRLPAPGPSTRIVVLHCDRDSALARDAARHAGFLERLAETTLMRDTLARAGSIPTGSVRGFPAGSAVSTRRVAPGFVAVGDAAQAYDPLSSQGVDRALTSGALAAHTLHYALSNPGEAQACLMRYNRQMAEHWERYLVQHRQNYAQETRWRDAPFWSRRAPFHRPSDQVRNAP